MEPETSGSAAPSPSRKIFFNDRGLRAGWRLLIYCGMIAVSVFCVALIVKKLGGGLKGPPLSDYL
jgi:hypothetical protein